MWKYKTDVSIKYSRRILQLATIPFLSKHNTDNDQKTKKDVFEVSKDYGKILLYSYVILKKSFFHRY